MERLSMEEEEAAAAVLRFGRVVHPRRVRQRSMVVMTLWVLGSMAIGFVPVQGQASSLNVAKIDRARILKAADEYLSEPPITVTSAHSNRSAGGLHDCFSEGD